MTTTQLRNTRPIVFFYVGFSNHGLKSH